MIGSICPQRYTNDPKSAGWMLNTIRITRTGNYLRLYFPRPWLLVGLCDMVLVPSAAIPSYNGGYASLYDPATHYANRELLQSIFLDLAYATTHETDLSVYSINWVEKGIQDKNYLGYFSKYLNPDVQNEISQWYNAIAQQESVMQRFFDSNQLVADDTWQERWYSKIEFLQKTININLMGAPGVYYLKTTGLGYGSPDWDIQYNYQTFENA